MSHGFHPFGGRVSKHFGDNVSSGPLLQESGAVEGPDSHISSLRYHEPFFSARGRTNMIQLQPDDAYLSYYDVRVMKEDVDCIKDDWLTDNVRARPPLFCPHNLTPLGNRILGRIP